VVHDKSMHLKTDTEPPRRVAVIGTSCSGKTTLARRLSDALACPRLELDALHWGPDWTEKPREQLCREVDVQTDQPAWVCCGNYSFLRDIVWKKADTIVWLNYSFPVVASRALRRTLRRSLRQEELWNGNRESFRRSFFSRESILLWVLTSYGRRRQEIPQALARPEFAHLQVHEFTRPADTQAFLDALTSMTANVNSTTES